MVEGGVELLVGVVHDASFGPVVACGAGGTAVELLKDVAVRITPLTDLDAPEMVRSLKTERSMTLAAGQALLATWEGTAFQVGYVLGQLAGIMIGLVMLRGHRFGRAVPATLIIGDLVGFGLYLPAVGVAISAFSGLLLWTWYLLIARSFLLLGRSEQDVRRHRVGPAAPVPGPFTT
jgi:ATP-grasp domain